MARRAPAAAPDFSAVRPSPPDFRAPVAGPQASQEFAPVRRQAEQYPPARLSAPGPMSQPPAPGAQPPASVSQRPAPVAQSQASVSQSAARPPAANHPAPVAPAAQPAAARDLPPTHRPRSAERTEVAMQPAPEPGGRRRAVTGTFPPVTAESQPDSGGRRRRAEGAPTWQETIEPEDTGSHSSGKSVSELLAAHGAGNAPRRHRRRGEE
ncbi:hypothetical protein JOD54_001652 [Actinokineospora baliensis]|nr:hypothetical protein [Actinokineospora baliensis]